MPSTRRAGQPPSSQGPSPFAEDLRQVLRSELLRDTCTAAKIANLLSIHRRTLHRYLQAEGGTFRQVADAVRFEIACEMLANTDTALSQVAATLKYSELSAFTRAFRRWSGQPPSTWRDNHPGVRKVRRSRILHRPCPDAEGRSAGQESNPDPADAGSAGHEL
jgi:AraC-like DNA-binding protein